MLNFIEHSSFRDKKSKESLNLIASNHNNDNVITNKIIGLIIRDLEEELSLDKVNTENIVITLKTISNLANSPNASTIFSEHLQLLDSISSLKYLENEEISSIIEEIDNNWIKNKHFLDTLIINNPTYLKNLIAESVHKRNVTILVSLFNNSVKKLLDASIVNQTNLQYISEKFSDEEMINKQLKDVLECEMIENMSDEDDDVNIS